MLQKNPLGNSSIIGPSKFRFNFDLLVGSFCNTSFSDAMYRREIEKLDEAIDKEGSEENDMICIENWWIRNENGVINLWSELFEKFSNEQTSVCLVLSCSGVVLKDLLLCWNLWKKQEIYYKNAISVGRAYFHFDNGGWYLLALTPSFSMILVRFIILSVFYKLTCILSWIFSSPDYVALKSELLGSVKVDYPHFGVVNTLEITVLFES